MNKKHNISINLKVVSGKSWANLYKKQYKTVLIKM